MLQEPPGRHPGGTSGGQREDRHPVAAAVLGGVHGRIGVERQRGLVGAVVGVQRDTDAGRDLDPQAGQLEGVGEGRADLLGDGGRVGREPSIALNVRWSPPART